MFIGIENTEDTPPLPSCGERFCVEVPHSNGHWIIPKENFRGFALANLMAFPFPQALTLLGFPQALTLQPALYQENQGQANQAALFRTNACQTKQVVVLPERHGAICIGGASGHSN